MNSLRSVSFCTAILLIIAAAPLGNAAERWARIRSKNFMLTGDATEAQIRQVAEYLEQLRELLGQVYPADGRAPSVPTTVVVFKNDQSFRSFGPANEAKPTVSQAYFQPGHDMNLMLLTGEAAIPRSILHDYVHQVVRDLSEVTPLWFTEGVAEYYGSLEPSAQDRKLWLGRPIAEHINTLNKESLLSFDQLFAVDRDSPSYHEVERQGVFHAQSWALVHYLMLGREGKHRNHVPDFLNQFAEGKPGLNAFQTAFQTDYKTIEQEFQTYLHNRSGVPAASYNAKPTRQFDTELQASTLTEAESELFIGDMLLHLNRLANAEIHLNKAIELDANLGAAHSAMGALRGRQKAYDEAADYMQRALDLDPNNYVVHFNYAELIRSQQDDQNDADEAKVNLMRSELRKTIELAPTFVEAYELQAASNLLADENYDQTVELLRKAIAYSPGRESLTLMLAQVSLRKEDYVGAGTALTRLVQNTSADSGIRHNAQILLDQVRRHESAQREITAAAPPDSPLVPVTSSISSSKNTIVEEISGTGRPRPEGETITGLVSSIDCSKGMTLVVKTDGGPTVRLHSDTPQKIQFTSYTSNVVNTINCGPTKAPGIPVTVIYRPTPGGANLGEPLTVEFTEKK
jgi:tetratricopeptide (TPR) repeat protein